MTPDAASYGAAVAALAPGAPERAEALASAAAAAGHASAVTYLPLLAQGPWRKVPSRAGTERKLPFASPFVLPSGCGWRIGSGLVDS